MQIWFLYLIRDRDNRLYTGITTDVERRFAEHNSGRGARNLKGRQPLQLYFYLPMGNKSEALKAEYRLKQWPKQKKERLPHQIDLQAELRESAGIITST